MVNIISRNPRPQPPDGSNAFPASLRPGRTYRLRFQRVGEGLGLFVGNRQVCAISDQMPLTGEGLEEVAVRGWGEVRVVSMTVWRMGSAAKPSPLLAGDVLVNRGMFAEAVAEYRRIAQDHAGSATGRRALVLAFLTAASCGPDSDRLRKAISDEFRRLYPKAREWLRIEEDDILDQWRGGRYDEAIERAAVVIRRNNRSRIALQLLLTRPDTLPPGVVERLLTLAARTRDVSYLNLSQMGISDLGPLRGMRLSGLDCSGNDISDLSPLKGLPLRYLDIGGDRVVSLEPLRGMALEAAFVNDNLITSLSPLEGMPLTRLVCEGNPLRSLAPFEKTRPAFFSFDWAGMTREYVDRVVSQWEQSGDTACARTGRLIHALRAGDTAAIRMHAFAHGTHRYARLKRLATFEEARRLAELLGGHLPSVTSSEECDFLRTVIPPADGMWLGLVRGAAAGDDRWCTGEPLVYRDFEHRIDEQSRLPLIQMNTPGIPRGNWLAMDPGSLAQAVVEWDEP